MAWTLSQSYKSKKASLDDDELDNKWKNFADLWTEDLAAECGEEHKAQMLAIRSICQSTPKYVALVINAN